MALPARADDEELAKENNKSVASLKGEAVFSIAKVLLSPPCALLPFAPYSGRLGGLLSDPGHISLP